MEKPLIIPANELLEIITIVKDIVPKKSILPIIQGFRIQIGDKLIVQTTDLEKSAHAEMALEDDVSPVDFVVPAQIFSDTLRFLESQVTQFFFDNETRSLTIKSETGEYIINQCDVGADFPSIKGKENSENKVVFIPTDLFLQNVKKVLYAVSDDELKPAMTGVYVEINNGVLCLTGTDANRLSTVRIEGIGSDFAGSFILHKNIISLIEKSAGYVNATSIEFDITNRQIIITMGKNLRIIARAIDAQYPNYNSVIPIESSVTAIIPVRELVSSLKRMLVYMPNDTKKVTLSFENGRLVLLSEDNIYGKSAREVLICLYEGAPIEIAFNVKYLMECLQALKSDEVIIKMEDSRRAAVLIPSEEEMKIKHITLLMPLMLTN